MKIDNRHIALWLSGILMLLCQACSSDGDSDEKSRAPSQLEIHVYTPGHPVVTRADEGYVDPDDPKEMDVNSLDIWVFVSENATGLVNLTPGQLVGHLTPQVQATESLFTGTYQITVNEDFANEKPNVDVYVTANVKPDNTGLSLASVISPDNLKNVMITQSYFGVSNPVTSTPADGLPMSGILKNQPIGGTEALMTVGNPLTPVNVVRAVSKVRFVFSRTETQPVYIKRITLNGDIIPENEYLFLENPYESRSFRIDNGNFESAQTLISLTGDASAIPTCAYPAKYAYTGAVSGQTYEKLIKDGIEAGEIGQMGRVYLKETSTERKLSGKIFYTFDNNEVSEENWKHTNFSMSAAGDFTRNHKIGRAHV